MGYSVISTPFLVVVLAAFVGPPRPSSICSFLFSFPFIVYMQYELLHERLFIYYYATMDIILLY